MRDLALPAVFLMTILFACQIGDLPPSPGIPGSSSSPFGKAIDIYKAGYIEANVLAVDKDELIFSPGETEKFVQASVTGDQYIYKVGYILNVSKVGTPQWDDFTFVQDTIGLSSWIDGGTATMQLKIRLSDLNLDENPDKKKVLYIIAYSCNKLTNGAWDCHENRWMIKNITAKLAALQIPAMPTLLSVVTAATTSGSLTLSWTASPGATNYNIYRATPTSTSTYSLVTPTPALTLGGSTINYVDGTPSLSPITTYYYKVSAKNTLGTSANATTSGTTLAPAQQEPPTPISLTVTGQTASSLIISWTAQAGSTSNLYRAISVSGVAGSYDLITAPTISPYTDSELLPSTTYSYKVSAKNSLGTSENATAVTGTTSTPAPVTLTVAKSGQGLGTVTSTSVPTQASQINCGPTWLTLCSGSFNQGASVTLTAVPYSGHVFSGWNPSSGCGTNPVCIVLLNSNGLVTASFDLPPFDYLLSSTPSSASIIQGSTTSTITVIATLQAGAPSPITFSLSGLPTGATATALASCTPSGGTCTATFTINSGTASAGTYPITITGTSGSVTKTTTFTLTTSSSVPPTCASWTYSAWSPATCPSSETQSRTILTSSPSSCTGGTPVLTQSCTYVAPTCTSWTYSAWGTCQSNNQQSRTILTSSPSSCTGGTPVLTQSCTYAVPSAPTGLTATGTPVPSASNSIAVNLNWNAVSGATSYTLYRATSSTGTYSQIASGISTTTYANIMGRAESPSNYNYIIVDPDLTPGVPYYYKVKAVNSVGESAESNSASITLGLLGTYCLVDILTPTPGNCISGLICEGQSGTYWGGFCKTP